MLTAATMAAAIACRPVHDGAGPAVARAPLPDRFFPAAMAMRADLQADVSHATGMETAGHVVGAPSKGRVGCGDGATGRVDLEMWLGGTPPAMGNESRGRTQAGATAGP